MAGIKDTFQKAAQTMFTAFDAVAVEVDYHSIGTFSYDATAGEQTEEGDHTCKAIKMIFENYNSRDIDNDVILSTDQKAMIPVLNLPVVPKVGDYIVKPSMADATVGINWGIINVSTDPAEAMWELQVRKP